MNDPRNRERLRRALELLEQVGNEYQAALSEKAAASLEQNPGPIGIGRMLGLSRQTDTIERLARELADLLGDYPPARMAPVLSIVDDAAA